MRLRPEIEADIPAIAALHDAAFGGPLEARIVGGLRAAARPLISWVAEEDGRVIGHLLFSPVTLETVPGLRWMGLAPMAVLPDRQGQGVGTALAQAGLEACREAGVEAVVVLGHPSFYPRFGFVPASRYGLRCEFEAPDEAFMALELSPGACAGRGGLLRFHPVFQAC